MKAALLEVVDHGVWSLGLVLSGAVVARQYGEHGLEAAVVLAVGLLLAVFVLGVTGWHAVETIDDMASGGEN